MKYHIDATDSGRTVKDFLHTVGVSAALAAKLKQKERGILLNGMRVTVRATLRKGDLLELAIEDEAANAKIVPFAFTPETVLETEDLLVVNKPPYMPTHPSHGHFDDTLANALVYYCGSRGDVNFRPRFINRLDRNTSGTVLVARHPLAAAVLSRAMAEGRFKKGYLALVEGAFTCQTVLKTGIRRQQESIIFREVCAEDAQDADVAVTRITPLAVGARATLVKLEPETGRTHQLRVHMAYLGHPMLGDDLYGHADAAVPRHALHAAVLSFPHPRGAGELRAWAPLPADLREWIVREIGKEGLDLAEKAFM